MKECNRCGRCCHYLKDGKIKKCKYLVFLATKGRIITSCRIWNNKDRVGTEIDKGIYCNQIKDIENTYVGCPFNREKQEIKIKIKPYNDQLQNAL